MKASSVPGIVLPLLLAVIGAGLIVSGQLPLDRPGASLPGIPVESDVALATPTPGPSGFTPEPTPSPTPIPDTWVAVQLEVQSVDLNVKVKHAVSGQCDFPPEDAAYVLCQSSEPGRGANSYIVAHAVQHLFKRLWNVVLGAEVKVLMSDGVVLHYVVTEIHPNVSCPDARALEMPNPPLALQYAKPGCPGAEWSRKTDHERLTLQTSQGFNRNWGELIIVAKPLL
ncbi:MAG: sortase [Chloroflexota bacterium]